MVRYRPLLTLPKFLTSIKTSTTQIGPFLIYLFIDIIISIDQHILEKKATCIESADVDVIRCHEMNDIEIKMELHA